MLGFVNWHHAAFNLVGKASKVAPPVWVVHQLAFHFCVQLAVVLDFDLCKVLGVFFHEVSESKHQPGTLATFHRGPGAFLERSFGSLHR